MCDKGFGGILADEMGLGKSVQLLSLLLARHKESRAEHRPNLIVCPASLVYNWVAEVAKHTPELRVEAIAGTKHLVCKLIAIHLLDVIDPRGYGV